MKSNNLKIAEVFVDTEDGFLFVKIWSPENPFSKTPIILSHNSCESISTWSEFPEQLAQSTGRAIIAYDRPGCGNSTKQMKETNHFAKVIEALSLQQFCVHDDGPNEAAMFKGQCYV